MIKVLVLLSTFNGENFLKQQIESLMHQKNIDVYCLVRYDGSTDNTKNILEYYASKSLKLNFTLKPNIGCSLSYISLITEALKYTDFYYLYFRFEFINLFYLFRGFYIKKN